MIQFCAHFTVLKMTALAGMEHVPLHIGVKIHVGRDHICLPHAFFAFLRASLCVHLLQIACFHPPHFYGEVFQI